MTTENVYIYNVLSYGAEYSQLIESPAAGDIGFGRSVALSKRNLVVGCPSLEVSGNINAGGIRIYTKDLIQTQSSSSSSGGFTPILDSEFVFTEEKTSSPPIENELFGVSVAINQHSINAGIGSAPGNVYYFKIPTLVESVEIVLWTQELNRFGESNLSEADIYLLGQAVDFTTVTWDDSSSVVKGDWVGSTNFNSITEKEYSRTGLNVFRVEEDYNKQKFLDLASGELDYHGFLLEIPNLNQVQETTSFYSNEETGRPEYSPELNIRMSVHPSPDD